MGHKSIDSQRNILTDYGSEPLSGVAGAVVSTAEQLDAVPWWFVGTARVPLLSGCWVV